MNKMSRSWCVWLLLVGFSSWAQVTPPCGDVYGSNSDENTIVFQMRYGSIADAVNAINQAKNTRGTALGCPESTVNYAAPNTTIPLLSDIENQWNTVHAPTISAFNVTCPRIGRYENNSALGAYYAMQNGYFSDRSKLAEIADMMYDQQYAHWNIPSPLPRNEGVYAYINTPSLNPCYPGGVVGSSVTALCGAIPAYCVTYTNGQFAGDNFATSGQDDANNWYDGGLAYDHGWVGVQMIESAIMQTDPALKQKYRNSVELAGQYALSEYCVKNHNYTAKLIWLLAELYAWTGDTLYRNELNYKLDKNLIPGILWDDDNDGFVDGTSPLIPFNTLTPVAQSPGRMWDGHNSLPWYQAMNTWALTEAYVAFRDQGDISRANELKPYVVAMLDNLSNEIITQGAVTPDALGVRDITYALLTGIWKVAHYENEVHSTWEQAAWAMWNTGYFNAYSTHSVCLGLYLLVRSETAFTPLHERENFMLSTHQQVAEGKGIQVYPNPAEHTLTIEMNENTAKQNRFIIFNVLGVKVQTGSLSPEELSIDISGLSNGYYSVSLYDNNVFVQSIKFIKQ